MKKNLLALFALGGILNTVHAQDTYINDALVVKVNPNTLFYNGGSVTVNASDASSTTEKIINEGNIQIQGNFSNSNKTGKNFVNRYTSTDSYGQLIINQSKDVTGRVVVERVKPEIDNSNEYLIAFPFQNETAQTLVNTLTDSDIFKGECAVNVDCGVQKRAQQSLLVWDAEETEYDPVRTYTQIVPYQRYLLQLKDNSIYNALKNLGSATKISFTGYPNNKVISATIKSGWLSGQNFADKTYGEWKNSKNHYNQNYFTYLGKGSSDSNYLFGKNLHRFGNPYTSNLDLSNIAKDNSWINFTIGSNTKSPTEVYDSAIRFQIKKISNGFSIQWNKKGNTSTGTSNTEFNAYLSKNSDGKFFWTGAWEALLVKPYEVFSIDYYRLNKSGNNNTRLVTSKLNLTDSNKTFEYDFSNLYNNGSTGLPKGVYAKSISANRKNVSALLNNKELKEKGLVTDFDFTQLELFLTKKDDHTLQGSTAYLMNASFMKTGNSKIESKVSNPVYFYEENENGDVLTNVQTLANEFNSENYIGKPIRIGFNDLVEGASYQLNLNLYEYSILNKVDNLSMGRYYLLDKVKNQVTEVNHNTEVSFVADSKINDRFEFFWNEKPSVKIDNNLETSTSNATYLYYDANKNQFVRFEQSNTTANIAVFDLSGRKIFSKDGVSTNSDFQLNLNNLPTIYIVKITYKDGKTVTKKTIKK